MTRPIPYASLEHAYLEARPPSPAGTCHWCSLEPVYHRTFSAPRPSSLVAVRRCPTPCVFLEPCDAPCHEVHWLIPEHHEPEECPAR